jgi:hypothetical protein
MGNPLTVEHVPSFDVHVLHRMGALREPLVSYPMVSFRWPGLVRLTANKWRVDIQFRSGATQRIWLRWSPCNFGGHRPWFVCSLCNTKVGKLYNSGDLFSCRQCLRLRYASQRRGAKSRRYLQALKLRLRLNGLYHRPMFPCGIGEPFFLALFRLHDLALINDLAPVPQSG